MLILSQSYTDMNNYKEPVSEIATIRASMSWMDILERRTLDQLIDIERNEITADSETEESFYTFSEVSQRVGLGVTNNTSLLTYGF